MECKKHLLFITDNTKDINCAMENANHKIAIHIIKINVEKRFLRLIHQIINEENLYIYCQISFSMHLDGQQSPTYIHTNELK